MEKLRTIRTRCGLNQSDLAEYIKVSVPMVSTYENDIILPDLEKMVLLQKKFGQRIDWKEDLTPRRKHEVVQSIIELCERFPIPVVMEFANRMFHREKNADRLIEFYAEASGSNEEPMPLTGIKFKTV